MANVLWFCKSQNDLLKNPTVEVNVSKFTCVIPFIFALGGISIAGDEPLTDHEKAAVDFTFEKMKIGMKIKDFKQLHPNEQPVKQLSDDSINLCTYMIIYGDDDSTSCACCFFKGILYHITIIYTDAAVVRIGGIGVLAERLVAKLGKVPVEDIVDSQKPRKVQVSWKLKSIARLIEMTSPPIGLADKPNWVSVNVIDTKQQDKINSLRRAKSKTGFDD